MPYRPLGNRKACFNRSFRISDATLDLFNECTRRADLLDDRSTADPVLHAALRLLIRAQDRAGARAGIDLSRPMLTGTDDKPGSNVEETPLNDGFRGAPRPPTY